MYVFVLLVKSAEFFYVHQTLAPNLGPGILIIKQSSSIHRPLGVDTTSLHPHHAGDEVKVVSTPRGR